MPTPIRELIIQDLQTTLRGIEQGTTYNTTVRRVLRGIEPIRNFNVVPLISIQDVLESKIAESNAQYRCNLEVRIVVFDTRFDDRPSRVTDLLHDVEVAVLADITRGGNAIETRLVGNETFLEVEAEPLLGVIVDVMIDYQHAIDDPASIT